MCQAINIFGNGDSSPADEAKLRSVDLRRRVGFTSGLGDGSVVCGLSFKGTLRPSPTTSDVGQSPALSVTCSVRGRPTGKSNYQLLLLRLLLPLLLLLLLLFLLLLMTHCQEHHSVTEATVQDCFHIMGGVNRGGTPNLRSR